MKNLLLTVLFVFLYGNFFCQDVSSDTLKHIKKEKTVKNEKKSSQNFQYDSDDIYTGKENSETERCENEEKNTQGRFEERKYHGGGISEDAVDLILNIGLIILWLALHH
ncbi:MAG: hypothetical protein ABIJ97_10705 [Bacteroidota bacterium]